MVHLEGFICLHASVTTTDGCGCWEGETPTHALSPFLTLLSKVGRKTVISSSENRILLTRLGELFTTIQNQMMRRKRCIPLCSSMRNKFVIHIQMQSSSVDGNMSPTLHLNVICLNSKQLLK